MGTLNARWNHSVLPFSFLLSDRIPSKLSIPKHCIESLNMHWARWTVPESLLVQLKPKRLVLMFEHRLHSRSTQHSVDLGRCDTPNSWLNTRKGWSHPWLHIRVLLKPALLRALQRGLTFAVQQEYSGTMRSPTTNPSETLHYSQVPFLLVTAVQISHLKYTDKGRKLCSSEILSPWREELFPSQTWHILAT